MARIALAGFLHETNTFSPIPTTYEDFAGPGGPYAGYLRGEQIFELLGKNFNHAVCGFLNAEDALGHEIIPILWTAAEPANQVTANAFERIVGIIAAGLSDNYPVDGVYLDLHGAMVFESFNDGETEILRRVRAIVGNVPIVCSLDLHGNISYQSFELAGALIGYRTYPHTDLYETGERCAALLNLFLQGSVLYKSFRQLPFLMPISTQSTNTEPCKSLYAMINDLERNPDVVSATIMAGFPPADLEHTGPTIFAYGRTREAAESAVNILYEAILSRESEFALDLMNPDQAVRKAIDLAEKADKPVILADIQDNSGGGATSDTTGVLEALISHHAQDAALGLMFDPEAAEIAHSAGEGAEITIDLGGKLMPGHKPYHGTFLVKKLFEGEFIPTGPMLRGIPTNLGKMANLQIHGVNVVVVSRRTQANDQSFFRQVGIEPRERKLLVLKSSNHYRADFEPISSAIIPVESPGAIVEDPSKATYHNLRDGVRLKGLGPIHKKPR